MSFSTGFAGLQSPLKLLINSTSLAPSPASTASYLDISTAPTVLNSTAPSPAIPHIPTSALWSLAAFFVPPTSDDEENMKRWSSFIGICIAITGNILISLALNIQKFAHMRLARKRILLERVPATAAEGEINQAPRLGVDAGDGGNRGIRILDRDESDDGADENTTLLSHRYNGHGELGNGNGAGKRRNTAEEDEDEDKVKPDTSYIHSPLWWVGLILMFFGECGNFLAYGFAPASIVSPLGVVALVSNCVIAPVMLKEPFRARDALGVLVSIAGAVTVVWSAEKEEVKLGPDELIAAISQPAFLIYLLVTLLLLFPLLHLSRTHGHRTLLIDLLLVGIFGGYTVLCTKALSSLVSSSFYHIFQYPIAYLFTFILALTAILQVKYLNRALQRFDSTQVIPTQFVLFTLSVILGSAVLYRDFEGVTGERFRKFMSGCGLTFIGVWLISSRRQKNARLHHHEGQHRDAEAGTVVHHTHVDHPIAAAEFTLTPPATPTRPPIPRAPSTAVSSTLSVSPALITGAHIDTPSRRPSEHTMIPGVMTGYQIGEVMRASGSLRRVTGDGDIGAGPGGIGRKRKGSLGEVVLGMLHRGRGRSGTGSGSVGEASDVARDGQRKRGEQGRHSEEVQHDERPMTGESLVSKAGKQHSQSVDPEVLEREWEEQEEQRLRPMGMGARDRER